MDKSKSKKKVSAAKNKTRASRAIIPIAMLLVSIFANVSFAQAAFVPGPDGFLVPHYFGPYPNYATSQLPTVTVDPNTGNITSVSGGIRKFVDSLPGLGPANANNLGQYIPVAVPDQTTFPGSDYYEIALVEYRQQMHSDLPQTRLRIYVQLETPELYPFSKSAALWNLDGSPILKPDGTQAIGMDIPRYLGPFIIAQRDVPVRVKFYNLLPTGAGGDLFLPVDTTVMGSGMGPVPMLNPDGTPMLNADGSVMYESYTQNRATLHLHGGNTPWISDGTPHQWITPSGEDTVYPKGVSVYNVPDMPNPGPGAMTFYYTNHQSARLMFYHDHSYGITRLNVYAGEAAGYLIEDEVEMALISSGIIPQDQIPLIIQDRTFVPDNTTPITNMWGTFPSQLDFQDPTWNTTIWGAPGDLWYPHVYMTMQNPGDPSGMNMFGRWQYSPWFWPPYMPKYGPVPNPYYDPANPNNPMEPPMIPGTPNPSMPGEAFMDTPVVNGVAYPYLEIQPKTYRFRILNAADDRFWNLQLYLADSTVTTPDERTNTEVKMVPAVLTPGFPDGWPTDGREGGVPDPATAGPSFIQIGNEGGFLPAPTVLPMQPVDWNWDQGTFDFSILSKFTLLLGTAERADVIVDFSQFAGKTLILYNDCPAPVPAADPRLDYFTGKPDQTDSGGSPTTVAGFGPNTRTIMQIRVANATPAAPFDLAALMAAFNSTATTKGAFAASQNQIIIPQAAYGSAYNATFTDTYAHIFDDSLTFTPIGSDTSVTLPMQSKAIHDEMNGVVERDYGRMAVQFGVELPRTSAFMQTTILYNYADPPTEIIKPSIYGTQIGVLGDGTQIWKIVHNGVDTHTVHWHMFEVQLINRVAWDNNVRPPDANELGWKETLRVNPLQNTYVALRPIVPPLPFDIPNSIRPLDPTQPLGTILKTQNDIKDPSGEPITLVNHLVNFGWEYVWHCHILAHEENDMMRAIVVAVPPRAPSDLTATIKAGRAALTWMDNSLSETSFVIQRASDAAFTTDLVVFSVGQDVTQYVDATYKKGSTYYYRVFARNVVGDTEVYPDPAVGFPHVSADSGFSNTIGAPTGTTTLVSLTQGSGRTAPVVATWSYSPSGDQTGFSIQRSTSADFTQGLTTFKVGPTVRTYSDGSVKRNTVYYYRVAATNDFGIGGWSNVLSIHTNA